MRAIYDGVCGRCGGQIRQGDEINERDDDWRHIDCESPRADEPNPTLTNHPRLRRRYGRRKAR